MGHQRIRNGVESRVGVCACVYDWRQTQSNRHVNPSNHPKFDAATAGQGHVMTMTHAYLPPRPRPPQPQPQPRQMHRHHRHRCTEGGGVVRFGESAFASGGAGLATATRVRRQRKQNVAALHAHHKTPHHASAHRHRRYLTKVASRSGAAASAAGSTFMTAVRQSIATAPVGGPWVRAWVRQRAPD